MLLLCLKQFKSINMKKITLILVVMFASILAIAQQVPNNQFETWSGGKPVSWDASNESILGTTFTCVTQETASPQSGTKAVKIETLTKYVFPIGNSTLPGLITLGEFSINISTQTGAVEGGVPFPYRPAKLKGHFMSQPGVGDTGMIAVGLSKMYGPVRDTIGYVEYYFPDQVTTWTHFEVDIIWDNADIPDSLNIVASSSNLVTQVFTGGSKLWLDSLYFAYDFLFNETQNVCQGTVVNWRSQILTQTGVYYDSLISSEGTDSVYVLDLTVNDLPALFNVTGGGSYNQGGPGVPVGLSGSETGVIYTLFVDGAQVTTLTGDGNALDFGAQTTEGTYTVVAVSTLGCVADMDSSAIVLMITQIQENQSDIINVFPNPANDHIFIESPTPVENILITDMNGRTVWKGKQTTIDVSAFEKGNYIISVTTSEKKSQISIVIR